MLARMRRTVRFSDEVGASLRDEAKRRGITVSEVVREAIEAFIGVQQPSPRWLVASGSGESGRADIAERIEEILTFELG